MLDACDDADQYSRIVYDSYIKLAVWVQSAIGMVRVSAFDDCE